MGREWVKIGGHYKMKGKKEVARVRNWERRGEKKKKKK